MATLITTLAETECASGLKRQRLKYTMQQMLSCRSDCATMLASGKENSCSIHTDACCGVMSKKRGALTDLDAPEVKKQRVAYASTNSRRDCSTLITSGKENIEMNKLGITTPEVRHEAVWSKRLPVIGTSKWESVESTHTVPRDPKMKTLDSQNLEKTRSAVPKDCPRRSKQCVLSKKDILKEGNCHDRHGCGAISDKPVSSPASHVADQRDNLKCSVNEITCQQSRKSDLYVGDIRGQRLGDRHGCSSSTTSSKPVSTPGDRPCTSDSLTIDSRGQRGSKSVLQSSSDGSICAVDDNHIQQSSHSSTGSVREKKEGIEAIVNESQFSDTRALRCEWLKKRFGDTILRAQHKIQECNGEKVDPVKLQQEKEILDKKTRDAEVAAEAERKLQRERKREAARIALIQMEKTVGFDDHATTMKDFAMLIGSPQVHESCEQHVLEMFGLSFTPSNRN